MIAAALSIQDPRERPTEKAETATQSHARFDGEDASDFMAFVRLWDHLRARQREVSGNQFRWLCRDEFLNYLRVREWQDLYSQLRQIASGLGVRLNTEPAHPDHVHQALLAGLLSHIGMREGDSKEFKGARGAKFLIGRGSAQAKRPARWVIAHRSTQSRPCSTNRASAESKRAFRVLHLLGLCRRRLCSRFKRMFERRRVFPCRQGWGWSRLGMAACGNPAALPLRTALAGF